MAKKNYAETLTTNIKATCCPYCDKLFPLGDARSMRRAFERHNCKGKNNA